MQAHSGPSRLALAGYGLLRAPLALVELPVFVLLPAFYSRIPGLELALIGLVLFATRLIDAVADPLIGSWLDRQRGKHEERHWIVRALPLLALGFAAMFMPPFEGWAAAAWLALSSLLTYLAYSTVSIAYQAWGSRIGEDPAQRARVAAFREGFGLAGVLAASALLAPESASMLVLCFLVMAVAAARALRLAPAGGGAAPTGASAGEHGWVAWRQVLGNRHFRWLLGAFVLNGVATAIPATLVIFFTRDVLGASEQQTALMLGSYFLAGALGMPLWSATARRIGLRNAWLVGIGFSVIAFLWAMALGQGDLLAFGAICLLTGLALGSDLVMPAALLAGLIASAGHQGRREGAYFGLWSLATKMNLAMAAGLALPLLSALGYQPGRGGGLLALSMAYAALPCALKLAAGLILLLAPHHDDLATHATATKGAHP